jgi:hypothetical protein
LRKVKSIGPDFPKSRRLLRKTSLNKKICRKKIEPRGLFEFMSENSDSKPLKMETAHGKTQNFHLPH